MEIDHGCLEKGVLNQELSNGLSQHGEETNDLEGGALAKLSHQHQETLTCLPQTQGWGPGDLKGAPTPQQQETNWSDQSTSSVGNSVDMENARTLVAFSASAGSLPPCSVPQPSHNPNTELYEKFNQEMANRGNGDKQKTWSGDDQHCTEDLKTLQMALNQARHGQKPPSCDCDGPDCPDYLEWLEKKIKIAGNCQEKGLCKLSGTSQTEQQHYQSQPQSQLSGANTSCGSEPQSQNPVTQSPVPKLYGPLPPIPCSPSVLSIAKERNVSLQTAIAIEALTQLSGTGGPAGDSPLGNSDHHASPQPPSQTQDDLQFISSAPRSLSSSSASTIPQSLSSRHFPQQNSALWEQHRPESQGSAQHPSQYQSTTSPFSTSHPSTPNPSPHQWQQSTGASCEKNSPRTPWMLNTETQACFPHSSRSSSDPMSELKQLLGDSSGKYTSTTFKFPAPPQNLKDNHSMMPHIKQEVNNGEYPGEMGAAMGQYRILSSQQQFQSQQIPQSIRYSTQAALQQHLHHKRNLFSGSQSFAQHTPMTCQTLRKWWPQSTPESPLTIKQEPREPKKKKNTQSSPLLKQSLGGLLGSLGPSLPKPKQIIIKKHKQKASQPVFLPQSQITVQKSLSQNMPPLPFMEAAVPPCPPPHNSSQVVVSQAAPAQSQESILNSSHTPISESLTLASNPPDVPVPPAQDELTSSNPTTLSEDPLATTSASQITTSESTPPLCGLNSLDPKFEEILRQFEEEFGDTPAPVTDAPEQDFTSYMETESHQNSNSGQSRPQSPSTEKVNNISAPTTEPEPSLKQAEGENEEMSVSSNQLPVIKQDTTECEVDVKPPDELLALATEAYLQQQHHKILVNPFTTTCSPPNKRMKIESSGGVTVLSTAGNFSTTEENLDTPTKESFPSSPSLKGFLESPLRYLDTPTKSLLDTPVKNAQAEFPLCDCVEHIIEKDEGPYYNHLGSGPTVASIRELMENRYGEKGEAVRIEKVVFTGREGKSSQGCPIAKWVIRRSGEKEKLLCLVRQRAGHHCANAVIIVVILAWEGIPRALGDKLYQEVTETITKYGNATSRRCGLNDDRTCACQGKDTETCGASFSFGCSWSMYFNGCKYARSKAPRKFRLQGEHPKEEELLRDNFQELATKVAPVYKRLAPQGYQNQCATEKMAPDCRLGLKEGRPFSGITACMDFCAHAHKDQHNLHNGCTVVCTLTKEDNRKLGIIPEDEQLHVLPLYKISLTDEFGSEENQRLKMQNGAIQVLSKFRREVRKLPEPAKSCRQRRLEAKKAASEKKNKKQQLPETPDKITKDVSLQGNKAIPKQEVKPTIKKESFDHFQAVNGALDGYPPLGNAKMCPDPYSMNGAYPSYPGPYARGSLPSNSQSSTHSPINGFHPNLQGMPYNYYNYAPKGLLSPGVLGYVGHNGTCSKVAGENQKTTIQSLQARLVQNHAANQHRQQGVDMTNHSYLHQSETSASPAPPKHTPSAPPDQMHRVTPIIKQEPMELPLYDSRTDGQVRSCPVTPSVTPLPNTWPGHTPNGSLGSKDWDASLRPGQIHAPFTPEKQRLHQQHHSQLQHSKYAQKQQQWRSYPGTPVASPDLSLALKTGPTSAPSPHPATPLVWSNPAPSPQPKAWGQPGALDYSLGGLRQGTPVGACPDKMMAEAADIRGSTPLDLQEKAWKSGGASAAGSNPSPAPEGRLFPDALQNVTAQACWDSEVESEREPEEEEVWSDSEHNFLDPNIGGVAVAPAHCSILIECARRELHATTPLKKPDRTHPTRISLVFYQHKNLNQPCHGLALWEAKMKLLAERARQRQQEAALLGLSQEDIKAYAKKRKWADGIVNSTSEPIKDKRDGVTRLAPTQHTTTIVTASPYAFTRVTGPYSCFM